jgi:4-nitrophenyl phosphatase
LDDTAPKAVVVGLDTNLTYEKLKKASFLIQAGATFIATNQDNSIPTPEGLAPGAGSLVSALKTASGKQPLVMGKPDAPMFEAALRLVDTSAAQTLMIGDRLNTDITGAALLGFKTALVLTGVSTRADAETSEIKPDSIYEDLEALLTAWD